MTTAPDLTIRRLASALNALRPDWPVASLETTLRGPTLRNRALPDVAIAAMRIALDPNTRNPGRLAEAGPWWVTTFAGHEPSEAGRHPSSLPVSQLMLDLPEPADGAPYLATMRDGLRDVKHRKRAG